MKIILIYLLKKLSFFVKLQYHLSVIKFHLMLKLHN